MFKWVYLHGLNLFKNFLECLFLVVLLLYYLAAVSVAPFDGTGVDIVVFWLAVFTLTNV